MAAQNISLIVSTLLFSLCAGTFVLYSFWQAFIVNTEDDNQESPLQVMLALLIFLGIGMLASATHLGQPFRLINAFQNPASMIAQEGIWSIVLGIILLIAVILAFKKQQIPKALYGVGSLASFALILVTSLVYVKAIGIPAWSNGLTIVYYFGSAFILGAAAIYFFKMQDNKNARTLAVIAMLAVLAQIIVSVAFTLHLNYNVMSVNLPSVTGLNIVRYGIGLLAPAIVAYLAWFDKLSIKNTAWIFMICVVIGEVFSRVIFFMQGIHL